MNKIEEFRVVEGGDRLGITYRGSLVVAVSIPGKTPKDKVIRERFRETFRGLASLLSWLSESPLGIPITDAGDPSIGRMLRDGRARSILDYAKPLSDGATYLAYTDRLEESGDLEVPYYDPLRGAWIHAIWRDQKTRRIFASTSEEDRRHLGQFIMPPGIDELPS